MVSERAESLGLPYFSLHLILESVLIEKHPCPVYLPMAHMWDKSPIGQLPSKGACRLMTHGWRWQVDALETHPPDSVQHLILKDSN